MTWLRIGEKQGERIETNPFNKKLFEKKLCIRELTLEDPEVFEPEMISLCAQDGGAPAFVPEFIQTHLCWAAKWLSADKTLMV